MGTIHKVKKVNEVVKESEKDLDSKTQEILTKTPQDKILLGGSLSLLRNESKNVVDEDGLTEEQRNNINVIKELWFSVEDIEAWDIGNLKNIKLTEKQKNNIKVLKGFWFNISPYQIKYLKDLSLTEEQIDKIGFLKEAWFDVNDVPYVNRMDFVLDFLKSMNLTDEQKNNIKVIKGLWFGIRIQDIDEIKNVKLLKDKIDRIEEWKKTWVDISKFIINKDGHIIEYLNLGPRTQFY